MPRRRSRNFTPYGRNDYKTFTPGGFMTASPDTQVGAAKIGKAEIDCRCRWSEAQWGCLDRSAPAGIIYNDITIKQPLDYWLLSAKICITMSETASSYALDKRNRKFTAAAAAAGENTNSNLAMARYYGPFSLLGPETVTSRSKTKSLEPHVGAMGMVEFGGLGTNSNVSGERRTQWEFAGERRTPIDGSTYRTLEWVYTGNEQEHRGFTMHTFSTAFAFQHRGDVPVFMRIEIEGELGNTLRRGIQSFSSHFGEKDKSILTEIRFDKDFSFGNSLVGAAQGLDSSMQERYYKSLPVRPPQARPWESPLLSAEEKQTEDAPVPEVPSHDAMDDAANEQELLRIFNHQSKKGSTPTSAEPPGYTAVAQPHLMQPTKSPSVESAEPDIMEPASAEEYTILKQDKLREGLKSPTVLMVASLIAMVIGFFSLASVRDAES